MRAQLPSLACAARPGLHPAGLWRIPRGAPRSSRLPGTHASWFLPPWLLVRVVLEADAPMRAVAERLVLRAAAAAERVALGGGDLARDLPGQRDGADDRVRAVLCHGDSWRTHRRLWLDAVERVAQRAGRTLAHGLDDRLDPRAVGIDPGLGAVLEYRGEVVAAARRMSADRAVVVDRDVLAAGFVAPRPR